MHATQIMEIHTPVFKKYHVLFNHLDASGIFFGYGINRLQNCWNDKPLMNVEMYLGFHTQSTIFRSEAKSQYALPQRLT